MNPKNCINHHGCDCMIYYRNKFEEALKEIWQVAGAPESSAAFQSLCLKDRRIKLETIISICTKALDNNTDK